jgi:hypothetical protein
VSESPAIPTRAASPALPASFAAAFGSGLGGPMMDPMPRVIVQTEFPPDRALLLCAAGLARFRDA